MKTGVIVFLTAAAMLVTMGCNDTELNQMYPPSISVNGVGTAYAEPDVASIIFGVDISRKDPGEAVDEAAVMMEDAMAAAMELGVAASDIKTTSYNMWVEDEYDYNTYDYTGEIIYHVSHFVQADVRDLDSVGSILSSVVSAGANSIQGVSFYVEDITALKDQARELAVEDAQRIADKLAIQLEVELDSPTSVSEWIDYYPMGMAAGFGGDCYAESPSISAGACSITLNVQICYSID